MILYYTFSFFFFYKKRKTLIIVYTQCLVDIIDDMEWYHIDSALLNIKK